MRTKWKWNWLENTLMGHGLYESRNGVNLACMKSFFCFLLFIVSPALSFSQFAPQESAIIESMASTFNFEGDTLGGATCFKIFHGSKQYFVTAAHLFKPNDKSGDIVPVRLLISGNLKDFDARVYFHKKRNIDVALIKLPDDVPQGKGISLDSIHLSFGSPVFFYGYPLSNLGTQTPEIKFPIIKSAILSGVVKYGNVDVLVLDGHNNRGFSGGPVVAYDTGTKKTHLVGLVSGYLFEPRGVQIKEERFSFDENSGIILCYGTSYIQDILKTVN